MATSSALPSSLPPALIQVKALCLDLLGTTLSWHPSVQMTLESHGSHSPALVSRQPPIDWSEFAHEWRSAFFKITSSLPVASDKISLTPLWEVYTRGLDQVCEKYGIGEDVWSKEERKVILNGWWTMEAWPDTKNGVEVLKTKYDVIGVTNGSAAYLISLNKQTGTSYDLLLTSDIVGAYKPNARVYQSAIAALQLKPEECAMVASHASDLKAAASNGMRTIYLARPTEDMSLNISEANHEFDLYIGEGGLLELARRLGVEE